VVEGIEMIPQLEEFKRRLVVDVLNTITQGNQIGFHIAVSADLAGETIIDISLGYESKTRFVAPTFSDSLFAPVVTRDKNLRDKISSDLIYLMEECIPDIGPAQHQTAVPSQQMDMNRSYYTPNTNQSTPTTGDIHDYKGFL
jgi:hypothetical protein